MQHSARLLVSLVISWALSITRRSPQAFTFPRSPSGKLCNVLGLICISGSSVAVVSLLSSAGIVFKLCSQSLVILSVFTIVTVTITTATATITANTTIQSKVTKCRVAFTVVTKHMVWTVSEVMLSCCILSNLTCILMVTRVPTVSLCMARLVRPPLPRNSG